MSDSLVHTTTAMGTVITIQIVGHGATQAERRARSAAAERAAYWFQHVSDTCSRFDLRSPLRRLTATINTPVVADPLLFEAIRFGLAVADASDGAFDPTVGHHLEHRGFNRHFQSGETIEAHIPMHHQVSYRDVILDPDEQTVTVTRPLVLDLGGLAKGLAMDLAARELVAFDAVAIDAGGDLLLRGMNPTGNPWRVGITHPRRTAQLLTTLHVTDTAVCTSGDYEQPGPIEGGGHHLLDPRSVTTATALVSATVLAPSAMVADALATAAFVLGPVDGLTFLAAQGVEGLLVTPDLQRCLTPGMPHE